LGRAVVQPAPTAESLGLIVTELVINALKHAFDEKTKDGRITVAYDVAGTDWKLSVADNGMGKPDGVFAQPKSGLGTGIVKALAKQLDLEDQLCRQGSSAERDGMNYIGLSRSRDQTLHRQLTEQVLETGPLESPQRLSMVVSSNAR